MQQLAKIFGVTVDALMSSKEQDSPAGAGYPQWLDHLPGFLNKGFRRFGWLIGVYIAFVGGFLSVAAGIMYGFSSAVTNTMQETQEHFYQQFPGLSDPFFGAVQPEPDPVFQYFNGILLFLVIVGILVVLSGAVLAWKLKKLQK